jgi:hypothetical protein
MLGVDIMVEVVLSDAGAQDEVAEIHLLIKAGELTIILTQGTFIIQPGSHVIKFFTSVTYKLSLKA